MPGVAEAGAKKARSREEEGREKKRTETRKTDDDEEWTIGKYCCVRWFFGFSLPKKKKKNFAGRRIKLGNE